MTSKLDPEAALAVLEFIIQHYDKLSEKKVDPLFAIHVPVAIYLAAETRDKLTNMLQPDETYDALVNRLLDRLRIDR